MAGLKAPFVHSQVTLAEASAALAEAVADQLRLSISARGTATLAVPGGTTPALFLQALGEQDLDWARVTVLPTDERYVPVADPQSNEAMIRRALRPLSEGRAAYLSLGPQGGLGLEEAAPRIAAAVARLSPLDIVVSGMGADSHIASLFPGNAAAALDVPADAVVPARPPGLPPRLSLSAGMLAGARWAALLISGAEKRRVLDAAVAGEASRDVPVTVLTHGRTEPVHVFWSES